MWGFCLGCDTDCWCLAQGLACPLLVFFLNDVIWSPCLCIKERQPDRCTGRGLLAGPMVLDE